MSQSTFLIKSTKNRSFGTGFCIDKDERGSYLVTCTHVVEECDPNYLEVNKTKAELLYIGSRDDIDLALIYVEGLLDSTALVMSSKTKEVDTEFSLNGFKPHKTDSYLLRTLQGSIKTISQIYSGSHVIDTYELIIEGSYSIEKGYSGSAIIADNRVIGVATDRNSNDKQAYAIPISYLKEIWTDIPQELWQSKPKSKDDFSQEVFANLDNNPLLLFSTDSYNHIDYIEHIRQDAINIFGKNYILEINCGRFANIKESDKFFNRLAKKLKLESSVEDSIDFEDAIIEQFEKADPLKSFILIIGFERLHEDIRNDFAVSLRNLQEECSQKFHLVIFGGEKLIQLKYSTGVHSYFNTFDQKMIPSPSFEEWQEKFSSLLPQAYSAIHSITGGYSKLTEYCLKHGATTKEEAKEILDESSWKSELFRLYRKDNLCLLFDKEDLGDAHPYSDNELIYRLYWDNLIVEQRGKFVWRSEFICELGRRFLRC